MYHCKLIGSDGIVKESFFRDGDSAEDVREGLELFCWPSGGEWEITDLEEEGYNDEE